MNMDHNESSLSAELGYGKPTIAFMANGQLLVSTNKSNRLRTIDPMSGNVVEQNFSGTLSSMACAVDRRRFAIAIAKSKGSGTSLLKVLDVDGDQFSAAMELSLSTDKTLTMAFNPTSDELAIGDETGKLHRVNISTGSVASKRYHGGPLVGVRYSPDGTRLATGGVDCQTHLIRCETSEPVVDESYVTRLNKESSIVGYHVGFLDDSTVCTTEGDRTIHLWNIHDGSMVAKIELDEGTWNGLHINTDSIRQRVIVVRSNWPTTGTNSELLIWERETESFQANHYVVPECVATAIPVSRSGRYLGVPGPNHTTIVDLETETTKTIVFDEWVKSCAFTHDERIIACAPTSGPIRFHDVESLEAVRPPVEMDRTSTGCIKFHPTRNILGSTGFDGRAHLYDLDQNKKVLTSERNPRYLATLAFSPDGRRIATGSMDGRVRMFSTATGDELFSFYVEPYYGYVSFSPNGESLAIVSGTERLVLHAPNQQKLSTLSRSKLDDIICRNVTFYDMNRTTRKK